MPRTSALAVPEWNLAPVSHNATGGALEGAERTSRETFTWNPQIISPDQQINPLKEMADARGRDSIQNDGYATGAVNTYRDSIVGAQYRVNAQPDWKTLGFTKEWADEFQMTMERRFNLLSDSLDCWFDAGGKLTFTGIIRLAVGGFLMTGEVLQTAEWLRGGGRPFSTAIQTVSPSRLSNPDGLPDDQTLSRGVKKDIYGAPIGYWIKVTHPGTFFDARAWEWRFVEARKPWGRRMVLHILDPLQPDQTRGVSDMVSVLKQMRMTKKFQDVTLQNAVVQASYAAAIESELPTDVVYASMGAGQNGFATMLGEYMTALESYTKGATNIQIDGVKMPHLFPGTKLNLKPMGSPGGVGDGFEESLLRHVAAGLGLSYEEFAHDYTKTNYSSARASMANTWKGMQTKKKNVADKDANFIYQLWMEEQINAYDVPLPAGVSKAQFQTMFYDPLYREAICKASWIGASRGQIDELKETQSALLRINAGLSTREAEIARLGEDWREVFEQLAREQEMAKKLGIEFNTDAAKPGANKAQQTMRGNKDEEEDDEL